MAVQSFAGRDEGFPPRAGGASGRMIHGEHIMPVHRAIQHRAPVAVGVQQKTRVRRRVRRAREAFHPHLHVAQAQSRLHARNFCHDLEPRRVTRQTRERKIPRPPRIRRESFILLARFVTRLRRPQPVTSRRDVGDGIKSEYIRARGEFRRAVRRQQIERHRRALQPHECCGIKHPPADLCRMGHGDCENKTGRDGT